MSLEITESSATSNLEQARNKFAKSLAGVEQEVDQIQDTFRDAKEIVSGRKLWRDHFWLTAAGSVMAGLVVGRPSQTSSTVRSIAKRLDHSEGFSAAKYSLTNPMGGSPVSNVIKQMTWGNPAFVTSLLSLGLNLFNSRSRAKQPHKPMESEEPVWHH